MDHLRPVDLAREHGISTQAVRNYEQAGWIPPAERTPAGYRTYTAAHAAALRAYLALVPAHGHALSGQIMTALHAGEVDAALTAVDRGHAQLLRDRETLDVVGRALENLAAAPGTAADGPRTAAGGPSGAPEGAQELSIGELARRLRVTAATLRNWEEAGILVPARTPVTTHRTYGADDVRDAELAHLLRRGGYPLAHIATVVQQIRTAGGTQALSGALDDWRHRLTARGLAMLHAAGLCARYMAFLDIGPDLGPAAPGPRAPVPER
ncbi:TioE family transcriptional regulator [Streptomyces antarcticus]|uniref:TioE family transcriptional regulator n=1 Tax=Streptomyces antarcticus TaxID=2996458 RepID=UPI00227087D3|nr:MULTISPECIES: TioE family transcriptional regulator [unclassified Streptomyces]MCY0942031.1 TioE family transcriptional regulator [Streptomyces sp. H34-AA3]MCZ4081951.1 TioE family transcriptional regulator [Streptomyces sp. H34-S5]